jgi:uncharacterized protein (TIGR03000 family)
MLHPRFLAWAVPAAVAAALLLATGPAEAGGGGHGGGGHGGGGHGGGGHGGGGHGGGGHGGSFHGGAVHGGSFHGAAVHHGGFNHGHGGVFIGVGGWGGYPYYGGYGYGGYPYYGGYGYGGYAADYYPAAGSSYYGMPPAGVGSYPPVADTGPSPDDQTAHVAVKVPANAEVWFGQGKTRQTGALRQFVSPALTPGEEYTYEIKARWMEGDQEVVQTRQVDVAAGSWKTVDFTRPAAEPLEPPKPKIKP